MRVEGRVHLGDVAVVGALRNQALLVEQREDALPCAGGAPGAADGCARVRVGVGVCVCVHGGTTTCRLLVVYSPTPATLRGAGYTRRWPPSRSWAIRYKGPCVAHLGLGVDEA